MFSKYTIMNIIFFIVTASSPLQAEYDFENSLIKAIEKSDFNRIQYHISNGYDVNMHDYISWPHMGNTVLSYAIVNGSLQAVEMLLQAGASVEDQSDLPIAEISIALKTRYLPHLSYAIAIGASLEIISVLVQYSKDLNINDDYKQRTPYEIAHFFNRTDVMALLEQHGICAYNQK